MDDIDRKIRQFLTLQHAVTEAFMMMLKEPRGSEARKKLEEKYRKLEEAVTLILH